MVTYLLINQPAMRLRSSVSAKCWTTNLWLGPPAIIMLFKAKIMFHLVRPDEPAWADNWDQSIAMLEKIQGSVASTKVCKNMLDPVSKNL